MTKLAVQSLKLDEQAYQFIRFTHPSWLKVLDLNEIYIKKLKEEFPNLNIVYRHYRAPQDQNLNEQEANKFADELLRAIDEKNLRNHVYAVEGYNETGLWEQGRQYERWTLVFAKRMRREGIKSVAYNFSTGNPPEYWLWKDYYDGLYDSDYLGLHEYFYKYPLNYVFPFVTEDKVQVGRAKFVINHLPEDLKEIPILITECGHDSGIAGQLPNKGYREVISDEEYKRQFYYLDVIYNDIPNVKAAFIFACGT